LCLPYKMYIWGGGQLYLIEKLGVKFANLGIHVYCDDFQFD